MVTVYMATVIRQYTKLTRLDAKHVWLYEHNIFNNYYFIASQTCFLFLLFNWVGKLSPRLTRTGRASPPWLRSARFPCLCAAWERNVLTVQMVNIWWMCNSKRKHPHQLERLKDMGVIGDWHIWCQFFPRREARACLKNWLNFCLPKEVRCIPSGRPERGYFIWKWSVLGPPPRLNGFHVRGILKFNAFWCSERYLFMPLIVSCEVAWSRGRGRMADMNIWPWKCWWHVCINCVNLWICSIDSPVPTLFVPTTMRIYWGFPRV